VDFFDTRRKHMREIVRAEHRQAVLRLIHSHERHIALLEQIGLRESANILRISWLDLARCLNDVTLAELEAFGDNVRVLPGGNGEMPKIALRVAD
jgi:hypothetical protein